MSGLTGYHCNICNKDFFNEYIVCPYCYKPLSQSEYVKVVRCKDCRFAYNRAEQAKDYGVDTEPDYVCDLLCCIKVEPDGFCKWGERNA